MHGIANYDLIAILAAIHVQAKKEKRTEQGDPSNFVSERSKRHSRLANSLHRRQTTKVKTIPAITSARNEIRSHDRLSEAVKSVVARRKLPMLHGGDFSRHEFILLSFVLFGNFTSLPRAQARTTRSNRF